MKPLNVDKLYNCCDLEIFDFQTTVELEELDEIIGQSRALKAITFGIGIKKEGYNLYAMGKLGSGKHSVVEKFIKSRAKDEKKPGDWCYVNNFEDPRKPISLKLSSSMGLQLKEDMDELIKYLQSVIPSIFESEEYREQKQSIIDKLNEVKDKSFRDVKQRAKEELILIKYTPSGYTLSPMSKDGKILEKQEYQALSNKEKEQIQEKIKKFRMQIENAAQDIVTLSKAQQKEVGGLERAMTKKAVDSSMDTLKKRYRSCEKAVSYLQNVEEDFIKISLEFLPDSQGDLLFMGI